MGELVFTIFGREEDGKRVRADVLAAKLPKLLKALREADKLVNSKERHYHLVTNMKCASATVAIKEMVSVSNLPEQPNSADQAFIQVLSRIYEGADARNDQELKVVKNIRGLADGAGKKFTHEEVSFDNGTVYRVDDNVYNKAGQIIRNYKTRLVNAPAHFKGRSIDDFVGVLNLLHDPNEASSLLRGSLRLAVGGKELVCEIKRSDIDKFRDVFGMRIRAYGRSTYDGSGPLPVKFRLIKSTPLPITGNLASLQGALSHHVGNANVSGDD
jgi:hypothetical protein